MPTPPAPARPAGTNLAIVAAVVAMPLVIATGFLSGRLEAERPAGASVLWPELRGTFGPDGATAEAAPLRPAF